MYCSVCGADNTDGSMYCAQCGKDMSDVNKTYPKYDPKYQEQQVMELEGRELNSPTCVPIFNPPQPVPTFMTPDDSQYIGRKHNGNICYFHEAENAVANCVKCGKSVCKDCAEVYQVSTGEYADKILCYNCCEELVRENVNLLKKNKKIIIAKLVLMLIGAIIGAVYSVSSGFTDLMIIFVPMGAVFFSFIKDLFKSIGQSIRLAGGQGGEDGEIFGIIFFLFKFIYLCFKCIVVAVVKLIQNIIYLIKTSNALEEDSLCLQQMKDYMEYTRIAFRNKGVDIETLINQNSNLYNNSYVQNYRINGEAAADAVLRQATTTIAENGEIIRNFVA